MEANIIVSCPYNPSHRISKFKLMSHIAKCKKTSKVVDKAECPLDRSHIVNRDCLKVNIGLYMMSRMHIQDVSDFMFKKCTV